MSVAYKTTFLSRIVMDVPACPTPIVQDAIERATRDFCRRSTAWRYRPSGTITLSSATAADTDISSLILANTELVQVHDAKVNAKYPLTLKTTRQLDSLDPEWETRLSSTPEFLSQIDLNTVRVVPYPSGQAATLKLVMSLCPAIDGDILDDDVASEYRDALIAGSLAMLQMMPNKAWTDSASAAMNAGFFESEIIRAKRRAENQHGNVVRTTSYGGI